jgi:hypothetical protein
MIFGGNIQIVFGVTKFCLNILAYLPPDSNGLMDCHIYFKYPCRKRLWIFETNQLSCFCVYYPTLQQ